VKEFSEQDNKLDEAIKYGFLLYSSKYMLTVAYEKMIEGLIQEAKYNEFEVSRINMSIFRLFEILLKLMNKSAKEEKEYSYEEALILYERAVKLVEVLSKPVNQQK
jgi:hypothetical protein